MSMFTPLLLAGAEKTLNHLLARDPAAPARLQRLAGQRLLLCLAAPEFEVLITYHAYGLSLTRLPNAAPLDADACVEIDADTLGAVMAGASIESLMTDNRLIVHGSLGLLAGTRELLMDLDINWEGALAEWFGEMPAHSLATGLRQLGQFGVRSTHSLEQELRDYMLEEGRWLAGRGQLDIAREHLTELEITADRLEARLARLNRRLRGGEHS